MTIQNTVVFRLVHDADSAAGADFLAVARATLPAIEGVEGFAVNRQISPKSDLRWQFTMDFADENAYAAYDAHPAHRAFVATRWQDEIADFQEYDFVRDDGV